MWLGKARSLEDPFADLGVDYIIAVQQALNLSRAQAIDLPLKADRIEGVQRLE